MIIPPIRKQDNHGAGHYHAPRGKRLHNGIDLACYPESIILSDIDGYVSKIGYPYPPGGKKGEYRYIEIISSEGARYRYFYVRPVVQVGNEIMEGNMIGLSQDLSKIYPGITHHIHVEIIVDGDYVDPTDLLEGY